MSSPHHAVRPQGPTRTGRSVGRRLVIATGVVFAVVALLGALVVGIAFVKLNQFDRVDLSLTAKAPDQPLNFLVVGSDSRDAISPDDDDADAFLGGDDPGGHRTDTIMVVRIDPATNLVSVLSVPRDLLVDIVGAGYADRINTAFAVGGAQMLIDTVQAALAVPLHHYVEIDFRGFQQLVETVGGVPMYFDVPMRDEHSGLFVPEAGCATLDGHQALAFARSRYLEYYDPATDSWYTDPTADLGRMTRQQLFLRKAMDKASTLGLTDLVKINRLVDVGTRNVTFDDGLSTSMLIGLVRAFASVDSEHMHSYALPTEPYEMDDGAQVLLLLEDDAQPTLDIFRGLAAPEPEAPSALTAAQVSVTVLNGTGIVGQAGEAADALVAAGFPVAKVGDASNVGQTRTTLRYGPGGRPSADLVAVHLWPGVQLVEDPSIRAGVVLTTGADFRGVTVPDVTGDDVAAEEPVEELPVGVAPPAHAPPGEACG